VIAAQASVYILLPNLLPVPFQVAYGKDGEPTKALTGFAAKNGVDIADCAKEADTKGVEYVWAVQKQKGRHAAEVTTSIRLPPLHHTLLVYIRSKLHKETQ